MPVKTIRTEIVTQLVGERGSADMILLHVGVLVIVSGAEMLGPSLCNQMAPAAQCVQYNQALVDRHMRGRSRGHVLLVAHGVPATYPYNRKLIYTLWRKPNQGLCNEAGCVGHLVTSKAGIYSRSSTTSFGRV